MSADIAPYTNVQREVSVRRILVATDFSEASAAALRVGSDIARAFDAEMIIVHVLSDVDDRPLTKDTLGMEPGDLLERRAREAEARLRRLESVVGRGHSHACVRRGSAATEILRLANEASAELIVVGWHDPTVRRGACAEPVAAVSWDRLLGHRLAAPPRRLSVPGPTPCDGARGNRRSGR